MYTLGDYNAHPSGRFYKELSLFCIEQEWTCIDTKLLGLNSHTYTFISEAHGCKRWLDHCLITKAAIDSVHNIYVLYDVLWSDHFPLIVECSLNVLLSKKPANNIICQNMVLWGDRNAEDIELYRKECNDRLSQIQSPDELHNCCDRSCNDSMHKDVVTRLYSDIVKGLGEASVVGRKCKRRIIKKKVIGWNRHVAGVHGKARQKFVTWLLSGKPSHGSIYEEMCEARKIFKSRLK